MTKRWIPIMLFVAALTASCNGTEDKKAGEQNDSISAAVQVDEKLENEEVEEMMSLINSVSDCLDSIQLQEKMIFDNREGTTEKEKMMAQLSSFKDLLARKQNQINELTAKNQALSASSKKTIQNLQKMVEYLNEQLAEKSRQIANMQELLANKDASIDELLYSVNELSNESEYLKEQNYQQDKEMNKRYYIVASKDELKDKGLLKGGFLKKNKVDNNGIEKDLFTTVDVRSFKTLVIQSKSPKIITANPETSYTLTKNEDGTSTLTILDADKFWTASNFLIIQL